MKKLNEIIISKVFGNEVTIHKGFIKTKGTKTINICIEYKWTNVYERHNLEEMKEDKYTTKIYSANTDIEKIQNELEKEFNKKLNIELRIKK